MLCSHCSAQLRPVVQPIGCLQHWLLRRGWMGLSGTATLDVGPDAGSVIRQEQRGELWVGGMCNLQPLRLWGVGMRECKPLLIPCMPAASRAPMGLAAAPSAGGISQTKTRDEGPGVGGAAPTEQEDEQEDEQEGGVRPGAAPGSAALVVPAAGPAGKQADGSVSGPLLWEGHTAGACVDEKPSRGSAPNSSASLHARSSSGGSSSGAEEAAVPEPEPERVGVGRRGSESKYDPFKPMYVKQRSSNTYAKVGMGGRERADGCVCAPEGVGGRRLVAKSGRVHARLLCAW